MGVKIDETYYTVTCFRHYSCCLAYFRSLGVHISAYRAHQFSEINMISQGSVAMDLRCGETFNNHFIPADCNSERTVKIVQYLAKL